ncbi:hypothetical protein LCGC14_0250050 [marine sediment metagenome]|uniref:Uncharacterized protein n=1 Tax=marine sediment metagenome TaxID=412755 RepID=A0A0F9ULU9_9ZZZZ
MMTKEYVLSLMGSSKNEHEWNANCDVVKREYGGYPDWWYAEIILSGLLRRTLGQGSDEIKILTK